MELRAIETELRAIGPVEIESDEFTGTWSTVEEFVATGQKTLGTLNFFARGKGTPGGRYLGVYLSRSGTRIRGDDDDHLVAGVQVKIEQIVRARGRGYAQVCSIGAPALLAGSGAAAMVSLFLAKEGAPLNPAQFIPAALFALSAIVAWLVGKFALGEILLGSREERPGWFKRNRDALSVGLVVGVVLLAVGYLGGRLSA